MKRYWNMGLLIAGILGVIFILGAAQTEAGNFLTGGDIERIEQAPLVLKSGSLVGTTGLDGTGSISGTVRDMDDNPVQGLQLTLLEGPDPNKADEHDWWFVANVETDSNGNYQFIELTERRYRVHSGDGNVDQSGRHYIRGDQYNIQVFDNTETPNIDFQLREAGLIWGYVYGKTDDDGWTPIPEARVVATCDYTEDAHEWHETRTDSNGYYELWLLPSPGEFYPIQVIEASIGDTTYEYQVAPDFYSAPDPTTTPEGIHGPDFRLNEGGKISGRVVNQAGQGLENVEIDLFVFINGISIDDPDAYTDSDGYYTIVSVPATDRAYAYIDLGGRPVILDEIKYSGGENFAGPLNITPGSTVNVPDMVLLEAGTIKGVVTDTSGIPIVGAAVEAEGFDINGYSVGSNQIYTDSLGQYTLDYIPPGIYTVIAEKDGWMMGRKSSIVVTSGDMVDCDLIMKDATEGSTVSGKAVNYDQILPKDTNNVPLPNYDDYQEYGIGGLIAIAITAKDYTDQELIGIGWSFLIGGADYEDGYDDYFVSSPTEVPGTYSMILPSGNVDIAGIISHNSESGGWYVTLHDWQQLNLVEGDTIPDIDITFETSYGTLKGNISVSGSGQFNPQKTVIIAKREGSGTEWNSLGDAVTKPHFGSYYGFGEIPAGTYTLRAISDGFVTQTYTNIVVSEGGITTQDIVFTPGGSLLGIVTDGTNPIEGVLVKIVENGKNSITDSDGSYTIQGLAAGTYTAEASKPGYGTYSDAVSITDGQTTTKDIILDSTVGSITGTVTDNVGNVNGATVVAYNTVDDTFNIGTTVDGAFTITELTTGSYILAVDADGYDVTIYPQEISLGPDEDKTGIDIVLTPSLPEFTVYSSVSDTTPAILSMTFQSDIGLKADPTVSIVEGAGILGGLNVNTPKTAFTIDYQVDNSDTVVKIEIAEDSANPVIPGKKASKTFSFELGSDLVQTSSTNIVNAIGGDVTMMGNQDNTKVYVPPFALAGVDDTTAVALTIERYGNPGDDVSGTDDQSVSAAYDFSFEDGNVTIDVNHTVTVTMSFILPDGMSHTEFEDKLEIRYFNVNNQQWQTDGITNIRINWNNYTIMYDVSHFSRFAAFIESGDVSPPVISDVEDTDITDTSALIKWNTDEPSDSMVDYGTETGVYTNSVSDPALVTSHSIPLTGLTPETTYYYIVKSTDSSGNLAQSEEHSFTTTKDGDGGGGCFISTASR